MEPSSSEIQSRRLSISHLLLLMVAIALMASWQDFCRSLQFSNSTSTPGVMDPWIRLSWAFIQGCLLASMPWLAMNYRHSGRLLYHPGHWILLINSMLIPVVIVAHTLFSLQLSQYGDAPPSWIFTLNDTIYLFFYMAFTNIWLIVASRSRSKLGTAWAVVFFLFCAKGGIASLSYLVSLLSGSYVLHWLALPASFFILFAIGYAVASDFRASKNRDFLHWFAVVITFIAYPTQVAIVIAQYFTI